MTRSNDRRQSDRDMIDAVRVLIGLRPLYRVDGSSSHARWGRGLMQLGIGDGNRRTTVRSSSDHAAYTHHDATPRAETELELNPRAAKRRRKFKRRMLRGTYTLAGHRVGRSFVTMGARNT